VQIVERMRGNKMTKQYDYKKTIEKGLWVLGYVLVSGALVYITDNPAWLGLAPVLEMAKNYLKHKQ
jgi:hypothetical protein